MSSGTITPTNINTIDTPNTIDSEDESFIGVPTTFSAVGVGDGIDAPNALTAKSKAVVGNANALTPQPVNRIDNIEAAGV